MTDDERLGQLYRAAVASLPGGRPDTACVRATARTRRRNRRGLTIAAAAVAVAAAVVVTPSVLGRETVVTALPTALPTTLPSTPASTTTLPSCPRGIPGSHNSSVRYGDVLVWHGRTYVNENPMADHPRPVTLGDQVTSISCNVSSMKQVPASWPDGTATRLRPGTAVYAVRGVETRCALAVDEGGVGTSYVTMRADGSAPPC